MLPGHPLRHGAMATHINTAQTQTLQDLKCSVTLNWAEEGQHEENRWEMLFHVRGYAIRSLVGKATLMMKYPQQR